MLITGLVALAGVAHPMDAPLPPRPPIPRSSDFTQRQRPHELGENVTVFVNFDGVDLGECNPSDALRECSWYNFDRDFPPFSGDAQTRVAILQAMRRDVDDYGIRVTGQRPTQGDYMMVVYSGTEEEFDVLGSAPSGDCLDEFPRQIAFAHVDGELSHWVNGGAMTALHEAGHTWGLDHIDAARSVMFPNGDNSPTALNTECQTVVSDTQLTPGEASCQDLNARFCASGNQQNTGEVLRLLFGSAYVDDTAPRMELVFPEDGQYFQAPADFDVEIFTIDDQHPQAYSVWTWIGDDGPPESPSTLVAPDFSVKALPVGDWTFHVRIEDEGGNQAELEFSIEVGEDPPPDPPSEDEDGDDGGCACHAGVSPVPLLSWLWLPLLAARRRRG